MKLKKEPMDVDFHVINRDLTEKDHERISAFIRNYKLRDEKRRTRTFRKSRVRRIAQ